MDNMNLNPFTKWDEKKKLLFAEEQLQKYGAKEGIDYHWQQNAFDQWAIFVPKFKKVYKNKGV